MRLHKELIEKIDIIRNQGGCLLVPTIVLAEALDIAEKGLPGGCPPVEDRRSLRPGGDQVGHPPGSRPAAAGGGDAHQDGIGYYHQGKALELMKDQKEEPIQRIKHHGYY